MKKHPFEGGHFIGWKLVVGPLGGGEPRLCKPREVERHPLGLSGYQDHVFAA